MAKLGIFLGPSGLLHDYDIPLDLGLLLAVLQVDERLSHDPRVVLEHSQT